MLNLSTSVDQRHVMTFGEVSKVTDELEIPFIVVGAMARDLILHHVYKARIQRATNDIDFGIQVSSWNELDRLKSELCKIGYREDEQAQRMLDPRDRIVDLVPFGPLQDEHADIIFPPKGNFKMSVLGFQDAMDSSIRVIIQNEPHIEVSVVSPPGLALLKIIAWRDRAREKRNKDAADLAYLIETYEKVGDISLRIYDVRGLMEFYEWDMALASAFLLGQDSKSIAKNETKIMVNDILDQALDKERPSSLIAEMNGNGVTGIENMYKLLVAFNRGFKS